MKPGFGWAWKSCRGCKRMCSWRSHQKNKINSNSGFKSFWNFNLIWNPAWKFTVIHKSPPCSVNWLPEASVRYCNYNKKSRIILTYCYHWIFDIVLVFCYVMISLPDKNNFAVTNQRCLKLRGYAQGGFFLLTSRKSGLHKRIFF